MKPGVDGGTWLVLSSRLPQMPEEGALGTERSSRTSPHPGGCWHRNSRGLGHRASTTVAQGGLSSLFGSVLPSQDNRPTQRSSEPGVGRAALSARPPARPPAHKGPIVWLRLWAAGGCPVPHEEALPPAAQAEEGTAGTSGVGGLGGPGWARVRHTQSRGRGMKEPILPGLALPTRPGQHVVRWSSPHHRPHASAWPRPGLRCRHRGLGRGWGWKHKAGSEQGSPGGFLEVVRRRRSRKWAQRAEWATRGPSKRGRAPRGWQGFRAVGQAFGRALIVPGHAPTRLPRAQTEHIPLRTPICGGRKGGRS